MSHDIDDQMYCELDAVIKRYADENEVSVFRAVGVLEVLKADILEDSLTCREMEGEDG